MLVGGGPAKTAPSLSSLWVMQQEIVLILTNRLRRAGISVDLGYRGKMKQRMKRANNIDARAAVIIGEDELEQSSATIRDLDSGEQRLVPLDDLQSRLEQFL